LGAATVSGAANITIVANSPPSVAVTAPAEGASYYPPATINMAAAASDPDGTVARVEYFNGTTSLGSSSAPPFAIAWSNVPAGTYAITAQATDNDGAVTISDRVHVTVNTASAAVVSPADGTNVGDDNVVVSGVVQAPANAGVFVNGLPATVDANGNFFVNNVPLLTGANTVTVSVKTLDNAPISSVLSVSSTGAAPFTVTVDPQEGFAPLTTNITIKSRGNVAFQRIELDVTNDGTVDDTLTTLPAAGPTVAFTYPSSGTYTFKVSVFDSNNALIYTTLRNVRALDPADHVALLTQVYSGMLDRLRAGNVNGALAAFSTAVQPAYSALFTELGANLPAVIGQLGTVTR